MKKTMGIFCAGVLILSLAGCSSPSDNAVETQPLTTVMADQNTTEEADRTTEVDHTVETDNQESNYVFTNMAKDVLRDYFGVDMTDTTGYSVSVQYTGAIPEFDVEQQTNVTFLPDELNFGADSEESIIDMETIDTKPKYDVSFTAEGEVKAIHISYGKWEKSDQPVTTESAKEAAMEFLVSHQLAEEGNLKILGSTTTSSDTITVVFQHKEGYSMLVGVDSLSGKVKFFESVTKNGAAK